MNILKTFLEYLEFYVVAYYRWFSPKSYDPTLTFGGLVVYKPVAYSKQGKSMALSLCD